MYKGQFKIILGSKSPRRSQLLMDAGFDVEIRVQDVDESFDPQMPVLEVAEDLAKRKAKALTHTLSSDELLITADSVVILHNKIYNKPADFDEGFKMLSDLSGNTHTVATGVCLSSVQKSISFTCITLVTFDILTDKEVEYYLNHYKPYDKAGAYGIQDWIGLCKVSGIQGSYSNVMGLPVCDVYQAILKF
jgi:septum formation protein